MYTIKILSGGTIKRARVHQLLTDRLAHSKFTANIRMGMDNKGAPILTLKPVRLRKAKPYCGQHADICQINPFTGKLPKKPMAKFLEFNDWISFHKLVNGVLNRLKAHANVFSDPMECKGRFWIRKDLKPRVKFDSETDYDSYGRAFHKWDLGSDSQFEKD